MATGFPVKANYATGDVLTAANMNDLAGTLNYLDPTAKGDLFPASDASTLTRLAVGTNGQVLTADSTAATGLKWASAAGGTANWSLLNAGGTALTGAATITVSSISGADKIMILIAGASSANASSTIKVRLNTDTGSNYYVYGPTMTFNSSYANTDFSAQSGAANTNISLSTLANNAASAASGYVLITGANSSGVKVFNSAGGSTAGGGSGQADYVFGGYYNSSSTISSISLFSDSGNFDAGTVYVYTSA